MAIQGPFRITKYGNLGTFFTTQYVNLGSFSGFEKALTALQVRETT